MDTILLYQDSIQATEFDFAKAVRTVKDFGMDPVSVVPAVYDASGNKTSLEVDELLDYAIGECRAKAMICGYLTDASSVVSFARSYDKYSSRAAIVARPSLISDEGQILVDESVYFAVCDYILPRTTLLIINNYEAELLAEFECKQLRDFQMASKKIGGEFNLAVWILPSAASGNSHVLFDGAHIRILPPDERPYNVNYSVKTAVACELVLGKKVLVAVKDTIDYLINAKDPEFLQVNEVTSASEMPELDYPNSHEDEAASAAVAVEPTEEAVADVVAVTVELAEVEEAAEEAIVEDVEEVAEEIVIEEDIIEEVIPEVTESVEEVTVIDDDSSINKNTTIIDASDMRTESPEVASKPKYDFRSAVTPAVKPTELRIGNGILGSRILASANKPVEADTPKVTEVPVKEEKKIDLASLPTISRTTISAPSILRDKNAPSPVAAPTSSLVSPAKSLRDLARSIDIPNAGSDSSASGVSPAVTSSLKAATDKQRSTDEIAALKERLRRLAASVEPEENPTNIQSGSAE